MGRKADRCVDVLLELIEGGNSNVVNEGVTVMKVLPAAVSSVSARDSRKSALAHSTHREQVQTPRTPYTPAHKSLRHSRHREKTEGSEMKKRICTAEGHRLLASELRRTFSGATRGATSA